jgi:hypothetical protein
MPEISEHTRSTDPTRQEKRLESLAGRRGELLTGWRRDLVPHRDLRWEGSLKRKNPAGNTASQQGDQLISIKPHR